MYARVGDINLTLQSLGYKYRNNPHKIINSHGSKLLKICKSFKCFIVNDLTVENRVFDGDYTFTKGDKKSQNNIIIANTVALKNIDKFKILDICWNPWNHKPVTLDIKLRPPNKDTIISATEDILTCYATETPKGHQQIDNSCVIWENYKAITAVDADIIKYSIDGILQNPNARNMVLLVSKLSFSLYKAAIISQGKLNRTSMNNNMNEMIMGKKQVEWDCYETTSREQTKCRRLKKHFEEKGKTNDQSTL